MTPNFPADNPYELLLQSVANSAIYLLDRDGRVSSWNAGAERIKGYAEHEILGQHFSHFYTEDDRLAGTPAQALATARETGRYSAEGWRMRKDGSRFWALVAIHPVHDKSGELIGFAKVTRDITDRHEAQQQAMESERRFRLLVEGVVDYAIYLLDCEGRISSWNAGAERIKGYAAREVLGEHFSRFYTAEDQAAHVPATAIETARREGRFEAEGWRVRKDGSRFWASVVIDAIRDEQGELIGFAKITRDMTERREAQRRLEETREQLFKSKMEALGQLAGALAHDINNLLTGVLGAADIGTRHLGDPDKLKRMFSGIQTSARRGANLTERLLSFARRRPSEPRPVQLRKQLPLLGELLQPLLRKDIQLSIEVPEAVWQIEVDPAELELTLLNLGSNACEAMPDGGELRLAARNAALDGNVQDLIGEYVALSVTDTGSGIPPELQPRIFEPFFTTKKFGDGTGLGLAQVYGFAQQSSGAIVVDSGEAGGTTMTLYLPRRSAGAERRVEEGSSAPIRAGVLVVEDDPLLAELAGDLIRDIGYEPHVTHSAAEALATLPRHPDIRLVFSDVLMPGGLSGLELARRVRTRYPELPILLTTGYSEAVGSGTDEFPVLRKPYDGQQLSQSFSLLIRPGLAQNNAIRDDPTE